MSNSKDLFDDSSMSFGDHLESLRTHLWKSIIGLSIAVVFCLFYGDYVIDFVRGPIDQALKKHNFPTTATDDGLADFDFGEWLTNWWNDTEDDKPTADSSAKKSTTEPNTITVKIKEADIFTMLKGVDPELVSKTKQPDPEKTMEVELVAEEFRQLQKLVDKSSKTVAFNVQETFMTYVKVSIIAGFVLASPWIFYQMWLFVAAGLYPHEKRYVYIFLPMSIALFIGGALFCFKVVFPFVLDFLLGFNETLGVDPQIRLSEWISFAVFLPVMFGISFQLPLIMLFLERINVFTVKTYREKRRISVLVISIISMLLTPADPMSMLLMMIPLLILYEFGIKLCDFRKKTANPFPESTA